MTLTILAYRKEQQAVESDIDTDSSDYAGIASGVQRELDCGRVIILCDGEVVYDTNDVAAARSKS